MNKMILKNGLIAIMALCINIGAILPFHSAIVMADENRDIAAVGTVSVEHNGNFYTIGNEYLSRTFSTAEGKLSTANITNKRTGDTDTVFVPAGGSEEFVIGTLDNGNDNSFVAPRKKLENIGWVVSADSVATTEGDNGGSAAYMFDNNDNTFYHSNYARGISDDELKYPHNIYVDLQQAKNIQSIRYQQRVDGNGNPTVSGHVKTVKLYTADSMDALSTAVEPVFTGTFDDSKETYLNLDGDGITARFIRIEFTDAYPPGAGINANVACCSEFNFYEDKAIFPESTAIFSSQMTLAGEPIEEDIEGGKTLTFHFKPTFSRGVEYTISEIITMMNGDSFMRKRLLISVPEESANNAIIDYIDLENANISSLDLQEGEYWTIPEQSNNNWMGGMKGDYLELGQPYYLCAMYFGCEFPQTENKIRNANAFIRYHSGKSLAKDAYFEYNDHNTVGQLTTWDAVVGAARSKDYFVVQSDFYEYIETIATGTDFRQQYNSWFDHMKDISADNIRQSFYEVEKGFTQHGVDPLDSYVVDDGWVNYSSFWDFNNKFPNQLYDSSLQVEQLGSNFGLWLGPRGGYGTQSTIANWIANNGLGSVNAQSGNDINVSDSRYLTKLLSDIFLSYQDKFNINYWKLDGMLLNPSTVESQYYVTGKPQYTISETYERWTDIFEKMREQKGEENLWLNLTSYVNPSPWHLQWVNSIWMQNSADVDFTNKFNATDEQQMLTYRDTSYYEFFNTRQWQLPFKYFYNHDPVYGNRTHEGKGRQAIFFEDNELREYLYMLGTRGTAFWEYYYSYNMFDDDKWDINAEAANWIKENFDILQKSKMFGGNPTNGDVYGYSCWNENEGIVSLRNPSNTVKTYTVTYDRLIGVNEDTSAYGRVIIGDVNKYQNDNILNYGDTITYTLEPMETLIIQYGEKDTQSAAIESMHADGNKVEVTFNETICTPEEGTITVDRFNVQSMLLKEDRRTVELILDKAVPDSTLFTVFVDGVQDTVGNITQTQKTDDYYENDCVVSIVNKELDGNAITSSEAYSIDGNKDFSVTGVIQTTSKNAEIVRQEGSYTVSIDSAGYLNFSLNGVTVNSKYTEKTINGGTVDETLNGMIADGEEHQFTAVQEVNGMLKLYIDGQLVASKFDGFKANPTIQKGTVVFGEGLVGTIDYVTIVDSALAYDNVADLVQNYGNIVASANNANVTISAYDVTQGAAVTEKGDRPFRYINDGIKTTANYLELSDTADGQNHSRYVQIDLGGACTLDKLNMIRYFHGSRTYGPTVIQLSEDEAFNNPITVYNSDTTGTVHNLGVGTDAEYVETSGGKEFILDTAVTARYIRIYVNGRTNSTSDHIVEFEAYGYLDEEAKKIFREESDRDGKMITSDHISVTASTQEPGYEAFYVTDRNPNTHWHSAYSDTSLINEEKSLIFKLDGTYCLNKITYLPRQDTLEQTTGAYNGIITQYKVEVKQINGEFLTVAQGDWHANKDLKTVTFPAIWGTEVRLTVLEGVNGHASAAEIQLFQITSVLINEENFPDANFRNYLLSTTYGSDGIITQEELQDVTIMDVSFKGIADLTGIQYFGQLTTLCCNNNPLTELDVSKNTALTMLLCYSNQLTTLDVSKNTMLKILYCVENQLTKLDVSKNTALTTLYCNSNQLAELDLRNNRDLMDLYCYNNNLICLNLSEDVQLKQCNIGNQRIYNIEALNGAYNLTNSALSIDKSKIMNFTGATIWWETIVTDLMAGTQVSYTYQTGSKDGKSETLAVVINII